MRGGGRWDVSSRPSKAFSRQAAARALETCMANFAAGRTHQINLRMAVDMATRVGVESSLTERARDLLKNAGGGR